ncbi:transketolase C-terminal domain-containing protein [Bradyrhizobium yuanmingense]|uniref:transketolase C-terminal domain-containing protein n=1 Tax=Bradyrhizobium yuanmingense TaxID=108015 RepID=UPI0023B9276E|nr:transketolase C-terminal domain-containing protein [Bradyrhizobium yuanmingense]MDF0523251.1 transketolase C-terminal domain-containing protein [Bradyrhizobium yuanmingense]
MSGLAAVQSEPITLALAALTAVWVIGSFVFKFNEEQSTVSSQSFDLRSAFSAALITKANAGNAFTLISVDSRKSAQVERIETDYPDYFLDLGVMEQCAAGVAAGLASCGHKVFVVGIASFITMRAYEQIRTVLSHGNYDVKIVGLWSGLYHTFQGHTHVPHEDVSIMRTLDNVSIYCPSTYVDMHNIIDRLFVERGFAYIRVESPFLSPTMREHGRESSDLDRLQILRRGHRVTIVSTGRSLFAAIAAADLLNDTDISCSVLNAIRIWPFDETTLLTALKTTDILVTVEEHGKVGGLASIISEILVQHGIDGVRHLPFSGSPKYPSNLAYGDALDSFGLTGVTISNAVAQMIARS